MEKIFFGTPTVVVINEVVTNKKSQKSTNQQEKMWWEAERCRLKLWTCQCSKSWGHRADFNEAEPQVNNPQKQL